MSNLEIELNFTDSVKYAKYEDFKKYGLAFEFGNEEVVKEGNKALDAENQLDTRIISINNKEISIPISLRFKKKLEKILATHILVEYVGGIKDKIILGEKAQYNNIFQPKAEISKMTVYFNEEPVGEGELIKYTKTYAFDLKKFDGKEWTRKSFKVELKPVAKEKVNESKQNPKKDTN